MFFLLFLLFLLILLTYFLYTAKHEPNLHDRIHLPSTNYLQLTYHIEPQVRSEPSVFTDPSVYVSFVIPAYNEESRLPTMLNETIDYLEIRASADNSFTYEILIVDDGSRDKTADLVLRYAARNSKIRLLRQPQNMGKGAAIQAGCLHARGSLILMVDADGATKIEEFAALETKLLELQTINKEVIVVGSRAHLSGKESKAQRTFIRKVLGLGFHWLTVVSGVGKIKDTQCGFKLFSREAAQWLFSTQHVQRWCFDAELLVIGQRRRMEIAEVPVEWKEIEGSKMKVLSMVKMAVDLIKIAVYYRVGIWKVKFRFRELR
jgi:dolichyl-phosphate beta-glucosyltransferase